MAAADTTITSEDFLNKYLFEVTRRPALGSGRVQGLGKGRGPGKTTLTPSTYQAVPALRALAGSAILAVEDSYVEPTELLTLSAKSDIALIPPISGG